MANDTAYDDYTADQDSQNSQQGGKSQSYKTMTFKHKPQRENTLTQIASNYFFQFIQSYEPNMKQHCNLIYQLDRKCEHAKILIAEDQKWTILGLSSLLEIFFQRIDEFDTSEKCMSSIIWRF